MACTYYFHLPSIIEVKRMGTFLTFFTIPMLCLPFEMLYRFIRKIGVKEKYAEISMALLMAGGIMIMADRQLIKKERYYTITIAEGDMKVCLDLCENYKDNTWTVISPTNDLSVIRYDGFHYEILDLLEELDTGKKKIYIPTSEIYVVTEQPAISFASDKRKVDRSDVTAPRHVSELSGELALQDIAFGESVDALHGADAPYYFSRDIVMSKLHFWMEAIKQIYPNHVSVFYKDDMSTVYKIEQDAYFTLNLSVDYKTLAKESMEVSQ